MTFIITVFGAGGKTGQECVKAALAKGDSVRAVVRDVKKYEDSLLLFAATAPSSSYLGTLLHLPSNSKISLLDPQLSFSQRQRPRLGQFGKLIVTVLPMLQQRRRIHRHSDASLLFRRR
jgi:NAD(P)-dependent dehydrogenase (short-subunit alcohol dehydrogenase family)